jgi:hypothetical protein
MLFDSIVLIALVLTAVLLVKIRWKLKKSDSQFMTSYVQMALSKLRYYPVIIILCWTIQLYLDLMTVLDEHNLSLFPYELTVVSDLLILSQGTMAALVFWTGNKEIRLMWVQYLYERILCIKDIKLLQQLDEFNDQWDESASNRAISCRTYGRETSTDRKSDSFLVDKLISDELSKDQES